MGKDLVTGQLGSVLCCDWGCTENHPSASLGTSFVSGIARADAKLEAASDPGLAWAHGSHLGSVGDVEIEA